MGSFKYKLVAWFALLALLPLTVAFSGYDTLAKRSETRRVDASLEAGLRSAIAGYATRRKISDGVARRLASDPALQRALRRHDRAAIDRIAGGVPGARVVFGFRGGGVQVLANDRVLGTVVVMTPIDDALVLSLSAGVSPADKLVAAHAGRIVAGTGRGQLLPLQPGEPARLEVGGRDYRGLRSAPMDARGISFAVLASQSAITAAARKQEGRLLSALFASLVLFGAATWLLGRSVVRTLRRLAAAAHALADGHLEERVEVRGTDEFAQLGSAFNRMASQLQQRLDELETERTRVREATARFGEAMVATHDPAQLVRIVVESAVEATGAIGGVVLGLDGELARTGDPNGAGERIAFPLRVGSSDFGSLVLVSRSFDADQVETAAGLAAQVVVALENARLHRIVERQAMVDSLTGLANRRSLEETLRGELVRATRFGDPVAVVLADLDEFKRVNDVYGHPAGDEVLKAFAEALLETVRESDVAGRWGGEEFALVLTGTDADGGARLAERARQAIEETEVRMPNGDVISVTASFGVAAWPECEELGEILAAADSALYAAKRAGRNRVVVSPESITA
jgi:diguanylate cyclase (GGDEF)-like protein